ncbi:hypothetical protein DMH04_41055 [Kibdelosporangium aridum]|uniref:Uncharacterized protein n=1 Tax=Kibdelosporangium aridum TaxID=2030 RepID=A0A428YVH8_KIBAR|nr:hypothetical protein [Kibdelosporangium aridum]RSM73688.1 hypothetical protein DMH04_41055 [Kibdelosporangium aridum]
MASFPAERPQALSTAESFDDKEHRSGFVKAFPSQVQFLTHQACPNSYEKEKCVKRILATLAAAASIAGLTLGAAGTANAEAPPSPIYVSEVSTSFIAGQPLQYLEIATASAVPVTLNTDVPIEVTFAGKTVPLTIPAGTTFAPGTGWVIAFAGTNLPCVNDIRPEFLPGNTPIQVRLIGQAPPIFENATIQPYANPMYAQHRIKLTPATFRQAPQSPCQFPFTPPAL